MLQLTTEAVTHLREVRRKRGFDEGSVVRFVRNGAGLRLAFAGTPAQDDVVITQQDLVISAPADVATALEAAVVDARTEDGKSVLILRRGKRTAQPKSHTGS